VVVILSEGAFFAPESKDLGGPIGALADASRKAPKTRFLIPGRRASGANPSFERARLQLRQKLIGRSTKAPPDMAT
jgi:hypothetical protein